MPSMEAYPRAAMERAMKVQDVMLQAMAKKITWWQAAEILGISDRHLRRWRERYVEEGYNGFRLSRALLVYGKSSYQGYRYRHPFVTLHEVIHDGAVERLAEGQLMTPQMLMDLMTGLGRSVPAEILPARVLVRTAEMIVWWAAACQRTMFFSDHCNAPDLRSMNGKIYPHPGLLFKACGSHLWVRALAKDERPKAESKVCMAPYWNCYDNGVCCTGSMKVPQEKSVAAIELWEESFFQSEFTHASGVRKHVRFRGGFLAMWQSLAGKKSVSSEVPGEAAADARGICEGR